jgi:hypothetical protein
MSRLHNGNGEKICETGRARVVARIGGSCCLLGWESQARFSVKGLVVRQVVTNYEDELKDPNGRYTERTMR